MQDIFYIGFIALAFTPEVLALFGLTLFKDQNEAFVGKYLLRDLPHLKQISFTPPKWLTSAYCASGIYSILFVAFIQKQQYAFESPLFLRTLLIIPVVLFIFPLVIGQAAGFAMISRVVLLWAAEKMPHQVLGITRKTVVFFLLSISRLRKSLK